MNATNDTWEHAEQQRERLEAAIHRITTQTHADGSCPNPPHVCAASELEIGLRAVDAATVQRGVPWHIGIKTLADSYERALQRMKEGQ